MIDHRLSHVRLTHVLLGTSTFRAAFDIPAVGHIYKLSQGTVALAHPYDVALVASIRVVASCQSLLAARKAAVVTMLHRATASVKSNLYFS